MKTKLRLGLPLTLGLLVLVIEAAVLLVLGDYFLTRFSREVNERLHESISRPGRLVAHGALSTDAFGQRDTLEKLVGPALDEAMVVSSDGIILVALQPELVGRQWAELTQASSHWLARAVDGGFTERISDGTNSYLINVAPVAIAAGQAPALFNYVRLHTNASERELTLLRWLILGASAAAFAVTSLALLAAVHLLVTRRLHQVGEAVRQVTEGRYETAVPEGAWRDEITYLSGAFNTMTARLREAFDRLRGATAEAEAAEQKYRVLVENAAEAIFVAQHGRFVFANPQCCKLFACTEQEALASTITRFVHPEDQPLIAERHARRIRGETPPSSYQFRLIATTGRVFWGELNVVLIEWKGAPATLNFLSDVTERREAEEAIRLSRAQLLASLENTPNVAIQWYDDTGKVLYWNPASERLYGWKSADAVGKTLDQLIHTPEETAAFHKLLQDIKTQGRPVGPYETPVRRADGSAGWVVATTFAIPVGGGQTGFVCMDMDITDRKQAEQDRERLQEQLLHAQKMESVGRLAGGVAHDFNNMLQAILGNVDLALADTGSTGLVREHLTEIKSSAQRSAALTGQLLAFARKQAATPRVVDLNETVNTSLALLRRLIGEHIELSFRPAPGLWPVEIDPGQMDQILTNLCVNARDAITGTGSIRIESANATLDEAYVAAHGGAGAGDYVSLTVSDTGCGMDAATKAHLFEPFYTTKELGKGTGLGLAMVFGVVKQNGGLLTVYSEVGRGTTFRIHLPRCRVVPEHAPPPPPPAPSRGHETVLLVEDEAQVLRLGGKILAQHGYQVLAAQSPGRALELVAQHKGEIQLLITDVIMPGMNGRELRDRLRATHPRIKCLFMSGYTADIITQQGIVEDNIEFVQKPFTIQGLTERVRAVLDS